MPLLKVEAEKLSQGELLRGVIEEFIDREELFALLPFSPVTGKALAYNREKTLATGDWLDVNENVNESASTFAEVNTRLRALIGDVDVDKFLDTTMSEHNSQRAIQIASKVKGMRNQFKDALINGTTANKQFDGIKALVTLDHTIDGTGKNIGFSMLDELRDAVKLGADVIMMRSEHIRAYRALLRTMGGNNGSLIQVPNFAQPILAHDGCPIIVNDYIAKTDSGGGVFVSDIYAMKLDEGNGLHGLFAAGTPAGFVIEDLGTVQNKDATRTRIKMYTGLALKSNHALGKVRSVKL